MKFKVLDDNIDLERVSGGHERVVMRKLLQPIFNTIDIDKDDSITLKELDEFLERNDITGDDYDKGILLFCVIFSWDCVDWQLETGRMHFEKN